MNDNERFYHLEEEMLELTNHIGENVIVSGSVGTRDYLGNYICIEDVIIKQNGIALGIRDHMWIKSTKRTNNLLKGLSVQFTAILSEYLGLSGDKQVMKLGLRHIRNIKIGENK